MSAGRFPGHIAVVTAHRQRSGQESLAGPELCIVLAVREDLPEEGIVGPVENVVSLLGS